jgi:LmeA-like phospholipid-binding
MRLRGASASRPRLALLLAGGLVLALALVQVLLPRIAAGRISSRVGRYGHVSSVSVSAWPAVKLLWGSADSVRVRAGSLAVEPAQVASLLSEAAGAASMDVSAARVQLGSLRLTDAILHKRGAEMSARALATQSAVQAALPAGFGVRLLRSGHGRVEVQATGALFGVGASVNAVAGARDGKLIAHPVGLLEGVRLTLFSSPHVYVQGVGASVHGEQPLSYMLTMSARLR